MIHSKFVSRDYRLNGWTQGVDVRKNKINEHPFPTPVLFLQVVKLGIKPLVLYKLKAPWMG